MAREVNRSNAIGLSTAEYAALCRRPLWKPIAQTVANLSVYAAAALLVTTQGWWPACLLAWPVMGLVFGGNLAAAHDCFHSSYLNSKRSNRIAGMLWCVFVLSNFSALKYAHLVHHRHTRTENDSEAPFQVPTLGAYARLLLFSVATLPRAAYRTIRILTGMWRPPHLANDKAYRDVRVDSAAILSWLTIAGVLTVLAPSVMVLAYWAPLALFPSAAILIAMPEHHGCGAGPEILGSTRTTESNWLVRLLIWNSNYHVEHHFYPGVPSCNLPALHRVARSQLEHCNSGYLKFHLGLIRKLAMSGRVGQPSV